MGFTLQGFGPFLHWLTLVILCVLPVLTAFVIYKLGSLPGAIAKSRGHPQADAINICGWMGVITIVLWPIAMVWAHLRPASTVGASGTSEADAKLLLDALRSASERLAAIESKVSTQHRATGAS
jgi:hypothetical protein